MLGQERFGEEWQAWLCSDCDPEFADDPAEYDKPYILLLPMGEQSPDFCPRCGGHLSFTESADKLRITNTPAERWAAKRAAGS